MPSHAPAPLGEVCTHHQLRVCEGGDAWWRDGCGRAEEPAQRCDDMLCEKGRCVPPESGPPCEKLSEGGRCDGDLLRYCDHGRARAVDCAALGRRCGRDVHNGEIHCLSSSCLPGDACYDQRLVEACEDEELQTLLCGPHERCELDAHHHPRCVRHLGRPLPCQGCACPSPSPMEPLPPIDVVAFLIADESGHAAESEERARARRWPMPPRCSPCRATRLDCRSRCARCAPSSVPVGSRPRGPTVREAELDAELHPLNQPFFVPVVFTRDITIGEKAAAGVRVTFPGSSCADLPPRGEVRDQGVILLARLRYRTTLAHELGHYFGLCHTHQRDPLVPEVTVREDGTPVDCAALRLHRRRRVRHADRSRPRRQRLHAR